jgi:hypothetical protein
MRPLSTAVPAGRAVAILAPLNGPNAARGQALVQAAQLALPQPDSPKLIVQDTGGTADGAAAAAKAAIAAGAGMIIGPLTAQETAAAGGPARAAGVPVLAFTSDPAQAQPGVWTLGLTPAQQVRRMVGAMVAQGKIRFAGLLPQNAFGQAMGTALQNATQEAGLSPPTIRFYSPGTGSISNAVKDISDYASRRGGIDAQARALREQHTAQAREQAADLSRRPAAPPPFDALLLADTRDSLTTVTSLLPYYDIGPDQVRVLGPALWAEPAARANAALVGAFYAAPDPAGRGAFDQQFTEATGGPAPGLADFAYDAASIARVLAQREGYSAAALCRPEGFAGVNGLLVLQPDGSVRRGLAMFQLQRSGPEMVEPAPESASSPAI